jgi:prepilin-type processing-associated H-X9-DG protein
MTDSRAGPEIPFNRPCQKWSLNHGQHGRAGRRPAFGVSRSRHPGGVNTLFGDGSVHFMKNSINPQIWIALGSINAGEVISAASY